MHIETKYLSEGQARHVYKKIETGGIININYTKTRNRTRQKKLSEMTQVETLTHVRN